MFTQAASGVVRASWYSECVPLHTPGYRRWPHTSSDEVVVVVLVQHSRWFPVVLTMPDHSAPAAPLRRAHQRRLCATLPYGIRRSNSAKCEGGLRFNASGADAPHTAVLVENAIWRCPRSVNGDDHGAVSARIVCDAAREGVPSDGATGSLFEAVSQLSCTTDPNVVDQRSGGGATCNFTPGP